MNLDTALNIACRTHLAALAENRRATSYHWVSGPGVGKSQTKRDLCKALARILQEPVGLVVEMVANYSDSSMARGFMLPMKGTEGHFDANWTRAGWYPRQVNMIVFEPIGARPSGVASDNGARLGDDHGSIKVWDKGTWTGPVPRVGILDLDEYWQADLEIRKPICELLLNGAVGDTCLPLGWRVMAASNRMSDRSGVMRPLMHEINRMAIFEITSDPIAFLNWCERQVGIYRIHDLIKSFAQKHSDVVFHDHVPDGTDPYATPRSLCMLANDLRALRSDEEIAKNLLPMTQDARDVAQSLIGKGASGQLFAHFKYHEIIPDMIDIETHPMTCKLPTEKSAQMVIAYIISYNVTEKNANNVMKYIMRLTPEMQIMAVRMITESDTDRCKAVLVTPEFMPYVMANKDILIAASM